LVAELGACLAVGDDEGAAVELDEQAGDRRLAGSAKDPVGGFDGGGRSSRDGVRDAAGRGRQVTDAQQCGEELAEGDAAVVEQVVGLARGAVVEGGEDAADGVVPVRGRLVQDFEPGNT
jgi:hypothetical protein